MRMAIKPSVDLLTPPFHTVGEFSFFRASYIRFDPLRKCRRNGAANNTLEPSHSSPTIRHELNFRRFRACRWLLGMCESQIRVILLLNSLVPLWWYSMSPSSILFAPTGRDTATDTHTFCKTPSSIKGIKNFLVISAKNYITLIFLSYLHMMNAGKVRWYFGSLSLLKIDER